MELGVHKPVRVGKGGRLVLTEVAYQRTRQHRPTPANTGQHSHKGRIRGFARQKMPREVNGNQNDRHPPKFDELKDVM
jgi:hypothetical protein